MAHCSTRRLPTLLTLTAEISRQRTDLAAVRLDRANLLAAIRAALAAHRDGEADPLAYLRDELDDRAAALRAPGGADEQLPADAPPGPPRPPPRHAAHDGHQHR